jgi:hypothetical protein
MLTRREEVSPKEQYYADSLLTKPTTAHSVFTNLAVGVATPIVALNMLDSDFSKKPEGKAVLNFMDSVRLENATPGMGTAQKITGEISNMIGFGLNPITWGLGAAGGIAARGVVAGAGRVAPEVLSAFMRRPIAEMVSKPIGQYIPSMYGRGLGETPLTLGLVGKKTLETFGTFAGAGVPQGIVDNYKRDTNHINWGGVAREAGEMGAFGLALGAIPFTWGVLRGKINRARGTELSEGVDHHALDQALADGHITEAERKWYMDYLEHQKNPGDEAMTKSLQERGSVIANENGHTANTVSNEALFEILTPNDVSNLHGAISDQVAGGVPEAYQRSLSDFIIHNRMDYIRQNPKWLDGVRGYVDFVNQKLIAKPSKIAEANKILDDHMLKGVKENMPFSQKEMFKTMKKFGFESSHMQLLPVNIPDNMVKHFKIAQRVNELTAKMKKAEKAGKPVNKQTLRRIEDLQKKQPKLLTPKEELTQLRETLLGERGLPPKWELSNAYHRLVDLSHVWHNARSLLERVHLEHEYNRQSSFRDLAHQVLRIADDDMPRVAKPENVMDYMKHRIEGTLNKVKPVAEVQQEVKAKRDVPQDADSLLAEQSQDLQAIHAEEMKHEFEVATERFKEFKGSENIFKNLISCVIGGLNA